MLFLISAGRTSGVGRVKPLNAAAGAEPAGALRTKAGSADAAWDKRPSGCVASAVGGEGHDITAGTAVAACICTLAGGRVHFVGLAAGQGKRSCCSRDIAGNAGHLC
mmetsp:Transcript_38109/g.99735  ORF Transcript_38109/g.99735 Transcript_38109/m.99735 type:complete len:107 (-) Transcript_38109:684-1004(-)